MTSPIEETPKIVIYGRDGKQLKEFKANISTGAENNLKNLIQAVRSMQKETNDFLTELVCQEKLQNNKNDRADGNVEDDEEDKEEDSEDDESASYSGCKFKKKRKI